MHDAPPWTTPSSGSPSTSRERPASSPSDGSGSPTSTWRTKLDGTPVTIADRSAERLLRDRIAAAFPDDAVVGEEEPDTAGRSGRVWILDPIDGTQSFIHGVPLYGNLVAFEDEHGPAVGVVNIPGLDECVWAGRGRVASSTANRTGIGPVRHPGRMHRHQRRRLLAVRRRLAGLREPGT